MDSNVVSLARRRPPPAGRGGPAAGPPVAFGVELPARGDLVSAVAALTQLITISDHAGLDATDDLARAIGQLRHRLLAHDVGLPPHLEEAIRQLTAPEVPQPPR